MPHYTTIIDLRSGQEQAFADYEKIVLARLANYEGKLEMRLSGFNYGTDAPQEIHVLSFPSEKAFQSFLADPVRTAHQELRDQAIQKTRIIQGERLDQNEAEVESLRVMRQRFQFYQDLGTKALQQMEEAHFHFRPNEQSNSIAILVNHMRGNMRSRFVNFFTEDGEKTWRQRDTEFEERLKTKADVLQAWEEGWTVLNELLDQLKPADLTRTVLIRAEPHTVTEALLRQLAHYAYHIGQILHAAKWQMGSDFESLSIPLGQSEQFLQAMLAKAKKKEG
jgi:uncharacterized protein (DUF1330 family)